MLLYYLACSEHLAFGYVDQPPLIAVLGWIARHTLGTSLPALIFWPALAGALRIILTAAFARELGAGRFGTVLSAVLAATPGVWWVIDHQFAMNGLEPLFWGGLAYVILRLINTANPKLWLAFGAIAGVGLLSKYSIVIFAAALLAGLLLTRQRRLLFTPWILVGGAIAVLIFLPNLIWNIQNHWPFLELMRNISATGKDVILSPGRYLLQQALMLNPASFPFWFGGLLFYFFSRDAKNYRNFGWTFVITIAVLHDHTRQGLLLGAGVCDVVCRRWRGDRKIGVLASEAADTLETGLFHLAGARSDSIVAARIACIAD